MANELTLSGSLSFSKNSLSIATQKGGLQVTVSGDNFIKNVQNVGTSEEQINFGDVSTPGFCIIRNLDATNYVEIRPATGVADLMKIKPGEFAMFRFASDCTAPFAIANTAAVQIEVTLIED